MAAAQGRERASEGRPARPLVGRAAEPDVPARRRRLVALLPWLALAYAATGFYSVGTGERAVVRRCGAALDEVQPPGLHFGFPFGIDRVTRVKVFEVKRVGVNVTLSARALGRLGRPREAECLTGDRNLILVSAVVQYRIEDAKAYLFRAADVPELVRDAAASALTSVISAMEVDDVLTVRRHEIRNEVRRAAQEALERYGVGVRVMAVALEGVSPPKEVAEAFRDVTSAREDRERAINEAKGYRNRLLPRSRGEATARLTGAEGAARKTVREAEGRAERFRLVAERLSEGRQLTVRRLILETMEEVLPRTRKVILDGNAQGTLDLGLIEWEE